ncbi:MAG: TPM domain-containing protein [Chloroflexota bacterium]
MTPISSWRKAWMIMIVVTGLFIFDLTMGLAASYPYRVSPYVNDYANVLTPQTSAALTAMLTEMQSRDKVEMSVITINSIHDYPAGDATIEDFALHLFNRWGLGNALTDKGILMVVAIKDHKVRIQLGDGYNGSYSDQAQGVITSYILPAFRVNDYNTGILKGVKGAIHMATGNWATGGQLIFADDPSFPLVVGGVGLLGLGILGFGVYSYSSHKCPSCGKSTLQTSSTITRAPTISHGGEKAIIRDCPNCGFHDERTVMLGALTPYYSSARSGRYHDNWGGGGSSSSGSSGGGGHSSGGGATGSW